MFFLLLGVKKMKYTEANLARIFILRLEEGDQIPSTIEIGRAHV